MNDYKGIITINEGVRSGKACIRGMRITVSDVLGWLASGMSIKEILEDFDELTENHILTALKYSELA